MPRLYREAPLASIWEGSGNVQCLDVLRALVQEPGLSSTRTSPRWAEGESEPRIAAEAKALREELGDMTEIEARARRIVERMALAAAGLADGPLRATRPAPTPSSPPASKATGARPSARCRPGPISPGSSTGTARPHRLIPPANPEEIQMDYETLRYEQRRPRHRPHLRPARAAQRRQPHDERRAPRRVAALPRRRRRVRAGHHRRGRATFCAGWDLADAADLASSPMGRVPDAASTTRPVNAATRAGLTSSSR